MGLLDDAIREHLELKRRRGADPSEVERAEREALGPVRRNYQAADGPAEAGAAVADEPVYDGQEEHWSEPVPEAPAAGADVPVADQEDLDRPVESPRWEDDDPFTATEPPPPAPPPPGIASELEEETSEYDVPAAHRAEEGQEGDGEDVLEETPDFLQDTPDHDRLWFEQRPPRDFDFDG